MNVREMLDRRATLIAEARGLVGPDDGETRQLSQEETNRYNAIMSEVLTLTEDIQRRNQLAEAESRISEPPASDRANQPGAGSYEFRSAGLRNAVAAELLTRPDWVGFMQRYAAPGHERRFAQWLYASALEPHERRALQADADIYGGYLYPSVQFVDRLIQAVDNAVYVRQWAQGFSVPNAESLGFPSLDNDPGDPTWTSELLIGSEDSTMSFGQRELHPHPLARYIKVSRKLLRKVPSAEALVIRRLGYKFSVVLENAYLNGNGAGQPLGVFTASASGINTDRDVSAGNTTTELRFDGLIKAKYTIKQPYWGNSRWLFHRDAVAQIAQLKDGSGAYIWKESVRVGEPDRILGLPVFMSEYVPNTFTTGLYVGILGDWNAGYWYADSLAMEMQRLDELYAATNQVGFIGRLESDGMPVLSEAFVRVKLA